MQQHRAGQNAARLVNELTKILSTFSVPEHSYHLIRAIQLTVANCEFMGKFELYFERTLSTVGCVRLPVWTIALCSTRTFLSVKLTKYGFALWFTRQKSAKIFFMFEFFLCLPLTPYAASSRPSTRILFTNCRRTRSLSDSLCRMSILHLFS